MEDTSGKAMLTFLMKKGDDAFDQKKFDDAIEYYSTCADLSRKSGNQTVLAEALNNISSVYQQSGNYDKSIKVAEQVLAVQTQLNDYAGMSKTYSKIGTSHYFGGKYELAIANYTQCLELRTQIGDSAGMGNILLNIGSVYNASGAYLDAMTNYENSLSLRKALRDSAGMATAMNNIGKIHLEQGNYAKALEFYTASLQIREKNADSNGMATSLMNFGVVYQTQGDYQEALKRYNSALVLLEKEDTQMRMSEVVHNIGSVYEEMGDYDKAMRNYQRSSDIAERVGNRSGFALANSSIGNLHLIKGEVEQAVPYLEQSLVIRKEIGDRKGVASSFIGLAKIEMMREKVNRAVLLADSGLHISQELGVVSAVRDAAELLHQGYRSLKRFPEALAMHELFMEMRDSINNVESQRAVMRQQFQYDFDKKEALIAAEQEKQDAIASEQLRRKNLERNASFGALGFMVLLAGMFFFQRNKISKEKDRSEELLLNILPKETADELKETGTSEAKQFDSVTVLFTDFKGFTQMSETLSPKDLVSDLHECFSAFDHICQKHGMEKIKTIGDAYMAAGGLPSINTTHAVDAINAALEMRDFVAEGKARKQAAELPFFEIRIGVHTGPVVAGIVGIKKFQYDIWGDTVNTASRMESSGEVGKVNISESTYHLVKDQFHCEFRGEVEAKGKGKMDMYFVT